MKRLMYLAFVLIMFCTSCTALKTGSLEMQGRFGEAEKYLESKVDPETSSLMYLRELCNTYCMTKNYSKLFECLDHLERRVNDPGYSKGLFEPDYSSEPARMRAWAWIDLGDYPKAIMEAKTAYKKAKVEKSTYFANPAELFCMVDSLSALGLAYAMNGEEKKARMSIADLENINAYQQNEYKSIQVARIYMAIGDYSQAMDTLVKRVSERSFFKEGAGKPAYTVFLDEISHDKPIKGSLLSPVAMKIPQMFLLSKLHLEVGDVIKAKKGYEKLVEIPQISQYGIIAWLIFFDRGRIAEMETNYEEATRYYRPAIDIIEQQRSTIGNDAGKIGFIADKHEVYHRMISSLFAQKKYTEAFEYVERAKARALVDMLASRKDFALPEGTPLDAREVIASLDKAEAEASISVDVEQKQKHRGLAVKIRDKIKNVVPQLASLVTVSTLSANDVQKYLQNNETLIEYYHQGADLYAFVISSGTFSAFKLDGTGLKKSIKEYRDALQSPHSQHYLKLSKRLYDSLIDPIAHTLSGPRLIIVPHGTLHYTPFGTLHSGSEYMVDQYKLSILPSASVMSFLQPSSDVGLKKVLVLGNPDLGNPDYDLKYAEQEARSIGQMAPESTVLLRKRASESVFRKIGGEFAYLHFATHGKFNADSPLDSALLLAQDNDNDGMLTAGELYTLNLHADLVTLSACETALGKVASGDDVVGFTRGFLYAGANSIVSSLWEVDDEATSILMHQFYKSLKESDKPSALRKAQLAVKDTYNSHPYFWGAFQITGL